MRPRGHRGRHVALAVIVAGGLTVSCAESGFRLGPDALTFPASLEAARTYADRTVRELHPDAYLWEMGGRFTILDASARGNTHSFSYYSPEALRRLEVHLFGGTAWIEDRGIDVTAPARLEDSVPEAGRLRSEDAMAAAIEEADQRIHDFSPPQWTTARLVAEPVWPEPLTPGTGPPPDRVAWRIDFLERRSDSRGAPAWWSVVRAYFDPSGGELLGIYTDRPELYSTH